ncbi:hypothetical protein RvY_02629 [Ramazzottius varieornatus]|uniref:Uncharacterized protein n=1 Tax=Ramazzottius varieornatus TaxID=947166 RepID=A0A1D1UR66_RAMVA|nr:hypothetical protein RvY_02629 [Ramazzottius varieornatus]
MNAFLCLAALTAVFATFLPSADSQGAAVPFGAGAPVAAAAVVPAGVPVTNLAPVTPSPAALDPFDVTKNFNDQILTKTSPLPLKERLPAWFKLLRDRPADDQ